jgi:thioredoxin 1|tara:strand:+ start:798 stop:1121 length:324 start_codon:yes stop_codon:yes gene_type:complete
MSKIIHSSESSFGNDVLQSKLPVMVDFWAEWCGPCRAIAPVLEELSEDYDGKAHIVKINVDENAKLSADYQVHGIPCLVIFKDGKEVERVVGAGSKEVYAEKLEQFV